MGVAIGGFLSWGWRYVRSKRGRLEFRQSWSKMGEMKWGVDAQVKGGCIKRRREKMGG